MYLQSLKSDKMSKRKREEFEDGDGGHSKSTSVDQRRLGQFRGTIEHSRKSLATALKLARGFERQKMGRRQKNATKEPQILLRLREEVIILKQLDLEKTANNHLVKSFIKSKRIRESPYFCTVYGTDPKLDAVHSTAEGNVLGRLFNSNPVKVAMTRIMKGVYDILGLEETSAPSALKRSQKVSTPKTIPTLDTELDPMEITPDEDGSGVESESESESEFTAFSDRDHDDQDTKIHPQPVVVVVDDVESDLTTSDVQSDDTKKRKPRNQTLAPSSSASTAFLPSLSMGGYYSGDSDLSDSDSDQRPNSGPAQPKERKNRRGQRARQQLAEMKFGKNAKHLQTQKQGRDSGWDKRKGAVGSGSGGSGSSRQGGKFGRGGIHRGRSERRQESTTKPNPRVRDDTGPIHPSWEAAKQRKSQATMGQATAAFAGKKTTFD